MMRDAGILQRDVLACQERSRGHRDLRPGADGCQHVDRLAVGVHVDAVRDAQGDKVRAGAGERQRRVLVPGGQDAVHQPFPRDD
ncbi:MAG: hypothetical protein KY393_02920, partial [Actinobacteria bacterium]|nr:hypothetical protein [Actinomycetota bacterium]